jgi:two-component system response regulator FlrC
MNQPRASILVVEDDPSLRDALTETLQYAGHAVRACGDGVEALAALHQSANISLIISDVQMPNLDGNGLLEQVKRQWPMIPMVLVTAFAQVSQAVNAIQNGASDYLVKPFEADHLLALVNRLI